MKRFKSKLAICLLSIVAMVFALTVYAGGKVQAAEKSFDEKDNGKKVGHSFTPSKDNPISGVSFRERNDGYYNVWITFDFAVFEGDGRSQIKKCVAGTFNNEGTWYGLGGHDVTVNPGKWASEAFVIDTDHKDWHKKDGTVSSVSPGQTLTLGAFYRDGNGNTIGGSTKNQYAITVTAPDCTHRWDGGKVTKEPTCAATGTKKYTCTVCSGTKTETVAKKAHSYNAATCEKPKTCKNCGATSGSALGHTWNSGKVTKEPSCTATGIKTYTCTVCSSTKTETIDKKSHSYNAATCTTPQTCKGCGVTSGSALGHTWDAGKVTKAANCIAEGTKTFTCTVCSETRKETLTKTGHNYDGSFCSVCGKVSTEGTFDETKDITIEKGSNSTAREVYSKTFTAKKYQKVSAKIVSASVSGVTQVELYDAGGTKVAWTNNGSKFYCLDDEGYEIEKDGKYTLKVMWSFTYAGTAKVNLKLTAPTDKVYKFKSFEAVREKKGTNWYTASFKLSRNDLLVNGESPDPYDTVANTKILIYREDVNAKKIVYRDSLTNQSIAELFSEKLYLDHKFKYYAVLEGVTEKVFADGELPTGTKKITLKDSVRKKLEKYGNVSNEITVPKPVVASVTNLKRSGATPLNKTVKWTNGTNGAVTHYKVRRYNKAGTKVLFSWTVKKSSSNSKTFYIPYTGEYKVTVTPYYTYEPYTGFSKTYTGTAKSITVTSPKLEAPTALTVTKISSKKVVINFNDYPKVKAREIYQKKSGGSWKKIATTTSKKYTVSGTGAGSAQYKFKAYIYDNGKSYSGYNGTKGTKCYSSYSKAVKTETNRAALGVSTNPNKYKLYRKYVYPTRLWYDGSKLKMKVVFINTHGYKTKCNASVVVKINGKAICSKTNVSATVGGNGHKEVTITLKNGKTGYDLLGAQETNTLTWYPKMN